MEEQSFGVWLQDQIQESDMTVKEAAEKAGPLPLLYFYLTDKRLPVPESARKLAEALEVDAEEVVQFARKSIGSPQKSRAHNPQRNVPLTAARQLRFEVSLRITRSVIWIALTVIIFLPFLRNNLCFGLKSTQFYREQGYR